MPAPAPALLSPCLTSKTFAFLRICDQAEEAVHTVAKRGVSGAGQDIRVAQLRDVPAELAGSLQRELELQSRQIAQDRH